MMRKDLIEMYSFPEGYRPPVDGSLSANTEYPNLNSEEYRRKVQLQPINPQEFTENVVCNSKGQYLLVTNDYRRRLWTGCFWGFDNINDIPDYSKSKFRHFSPNPITAIRFLQDGIVVFGNATGGVEVWELRTDESQKINVYKIDSKSEHVDIVSGLEQFKESPHKFVTADWNGCLKVWEMDNLELINYNTYHHAHSDAITGISTDPKSELFLSVSRDKSVLLWDHRQARPASGMLEDYRFPLNAVEWNQEITVGDVDGNILKLDQRNPGKVVAEQNILNRGIRKIVSQDGRTLVCGNTTKAKLLNDKWECLHEVKATDMIRDVFFKDDFAWFLAMNGHILKHNLNK